MVMRGEQVLCFCCAEVPHAWGGELRVELSGLYPYAFLAVLACGVVRSFATSLLDTRQLSASSFFCD